MMVGLLPGLRGRAGGVGMVASRWRGLRAVLDRGFGWQGWGVGVFAADPVGFVFVVEGDGDFGHVGGWGVGCWGDDGVFFVVGGGGL